MTCNMTLEGSSMGARSGTGGAGAGAADETPPSIVGGGGAAEDLANHQSAPSSRQRPRPVRQKRRSARMESEASKTAEAAVAKTVPKEKTTTDIDIGLGQAELSAAVRAAATIQATIEVSPYIQRSKKGPKRPMTSYTAFVKSIRPIIMQTSEKSFKDVAVLVAAEWHRLTLAHRKPYEALALADRQRFKNEKLKWEADKEDDGDGHGSAAAAAAAGNPRYQQGTAHKLAGLASGSAAASTDFNSTTPQNVVGRQSLYLGEAIEPSAWLSEEANKSSAEKRPRRKKCKMESIAGPSTPLVPPEKATVSIQTDEGGEAWTSF